MSYVQEVETDKGTILAYGGRVDESTVRNHLSAHVHQLTDEIAVLEASVTKLDDLRGQLSRAEDALRVFNAQADALPATMYECGYCPRAFTTKRGLGRHLSVAHKDRDQMEGVYP